MALVCITAYCAIGALCSVACLYGIPKQSEYDDVNERAAMLMFFAWPIMLPIVLAIWIGSEIGRVIK